jgi:alkanesulfonate monooxygenase SsuD/methylene tetrahydromethanopterin reductase-like flavin-dependent oxidoreductase (luciferase family)
MSVLAAIFGCAHSASALERRLDLALRKRATKAQERSRRVDWMAQAEVVARATRETGEEYDLPLDVNGQPAPDPELAERQYPHDS